MIGGLLGGLVRRNEETGLNPLQNIAASMDALVMPKYRMGEQIRQAGVQRVAADRRNATIAEMQKRADAGDTIAQRYLQGIQSGALDMKTGFAGYLNEVAANERLQREINARAALARAKPTATSATEKKYDFLRRMGMTHEQALAEAMKTGGGITIGGQEKEFDKSMGQFYAERNINMANDAQSAVSALNTIQVQRNLTQDPSFRSGTGQELFNSASSLLEQLGIGEADIASGEAFRAFASQSVLDALGGSLGTGVSNADVTFINNTVANLSNSGAGIATILDIREKLYRRKLETAELARQWMADNNTQFLDQRWDQYIANWNDENPIFPNADSYF